MVVVVGNVVVLCLLLYLPTCPRYTSVVTCWTVEWGCVYVWLLLHRQRVLAMQDALDDHGLEIAIAERREEASL